MNLTKVPMTFWIIGVIALLWNLMGLSAFLYDVTMTPERLAELPVEMQEIYNNNPFWVKTAYGVATIGGTLGAIGLLMRKGWSVTLFLLSLLGIIIQTSYNFFGTNLREFATTEELILPVMVMIIALFLWYYAKKATSRGWFT
jgi:hypothetical protein